MVDDDEPAADELEDDGTVDEEPGEVVATEVLEEATEVGVVSVTDGPGLTATFDTFTALDDL